MGVVRHLVFRRKVVDVLGCMTYRHFQHNGAMAAAGSVTDDLAKLCRPFVSVYFVLFQYRFTITQTGIGQTKPDLGHNRILIGALSQ